ncbi:MAG: 5'-methylthioadenosine/S-adenosylhomocysteine nucleosidase [Eubacteriales bacterium]|nr:5'-methylthioadenosine/S-adenosylhomocysteine nucleosidase [Eubacteriales bacterium]
MIAVICALETELKACLARCSQLIHVEDNTVLPHYRAELEGHQLVLCQSGIGKCHAAVSLSYLLCRYEIDEIINVGTAGGLQGFEEICDIIIAKRCAYHDLHLDGNFHSDNAPFRYDCDDQLIENFSQVLNELGYRHHIGLLVSGDQFVHRPEQFNKILHYYPDALATDCESCSLAQTAARFAKKILVIRSLSDICLRENAEDFYSYCKKASERASAALQLYLRERSQH